MFVLKLTEGGYLYVGMDSIGFTAQSVVNEEEATVFSHRAEALDVLRGLDTYWQDQAVISTPSEFPF